jgi:hypothetical protein
MSEEYEDDGFAELPEYMQEAIRNDDTLREEVIRVGKIINHWEQNEEGYPRYCTCAVALAIEIHDLNKENQSFRRSLTNQEPSVYV